MLNQDILYGTTRGGHELPPELQDRPEQNRGYDEAVHGGRDEERLEDPLAEDGDEDEATPEDEAPGDDA